MIQPRQHRRLAHEAAAGFDVEQRQHQQLDGGTLLDAITSSPAGVDHTHAAAPQLFLQHPAVQLTTDQIQPGPCTGFNQCTPRQ